MVKLLMLITSLSEGGAEKAASELSLNLKPEIERRIVILMNKVSYPSNEPPISLNLGLGRFKALSMIWMVIVGTYKYKKLLSEHRPDTSLSFLILDNFINVISNLGSKRTKVVISVHTTLSMKLRNSPGRGIIKHLINSLYNRSDTVIAVSEGVKNELIHEFKIDPQKIEVIHNPLDVNEIQHLSLEEVTEDWMSAEMPIIANVGGLKKAKGQWHLIRSFSKVRKNVECKLLICGEGELRPCLEGLVRDLDLISDIKFLGWKKNPFKYIARSSLFVFSSLWEALPYALVEAMACGCPVIAADCRYGPREILGDNQYGLLIPPLDGRFRQASDPLTPEEDHLANVILEALKDKQMLHSYGELAQRRASIFDKASIIEKYEEILSGDSADCR